MPKTFTLQEVMKIENVGKKFSPVSEREVFEVCRESENYVSLRDEDYGGLIEDGYVLNYLINL